MASCSVCGGKASLRLATHQCTGVRRFGLCSECLRDCYVLDEGTVWDEGPGESSSLPVISCPHCHQRAQVLEAPAFKRLRQSLAAAAPGPRSDWEILGLPQGSCRREIARAYRRRAPECHPDKEGGSHESFVALTDAHDRLMTLMEDVTAEQDERAKALKRILSDVKVGKWSARLREEPIGTLRALRAHLEGRELQRREENAQPICDAVTAEKSKRVMIRGIVTQVRRRRVVYHVRMSFKGMVVETEESERLDETLRLRSEIVRIKAQGEKLEGVQDALKGFRTANGVLWFHQEAGSKYRNITPRTMDVETAMHYGQRLKNAAKKGKDDMKKEQDRQKKELNAVRQATAKAAAQLHGMVNELLLPPARPVARRLTGKQRPPPAYLALADGVAAQEAPREEVPQEAREESHDEGPRARSPDADPPRGWLRQRIKGALRWWQKP